MPLDLKDNQYTLDYKAFETKIIEENVKMMIFCNPHNPVGKVWTKEELKTIGDICKNIMSLSYRMKSIWTLSMYLISISHSMK